MVRGGGKMRITWSGSPTTFQEGVRFSLLGRPVRGPSKVLSGSLKMSLSHGAQRMKKDGLRSPVGGKISARAGRIPLRQLRRCAEPTQPLNENCDHESWSFGQ